MSKLYLALAVSALIALAVGGAFFAGMYFQEQSQQLRDLEDYKKGMENADTALDDVRSDGACGWLRKTFGGEGCGTSGPDTPLD